MAVRNIKRRGRRVLVIDIRYRKPDGTPGRFRRDAEVQTREAARAEDRRRLVWLATSGSPELLAPPQFGEPVAEAPASPTFREVASEYLRTFAVCHLKPSTRHGYSAVIKGFLVPRIGADRIDTIDAKKVRSLDAELVARGRMPATRRQMQAVLRSILCRHAVETGLLAGPPSLPRLPKSGLKIMNALTREEVDRILTISRPAQKLAYLLAAYAGLRAGEIRGLRWRDVDLEVGHLIVRQSICHGEVAAPKSGHERVVPLVPALRDALAAERKRQPPDAFVSLNGWGRPWTERGMLQAFQRACGRAGLPVWRFHDLRHYFVTALFRRGVSAPTVQALAGHANLTTTQRYAHVARVDLREAIDRLAG